MVFPYSLDSVHFDIDFLEKKQKQTNNYGKNLHYQIYDKLHFDSLHVQESILCNSSLSQRNNNKEPLNRKMEVHFSNEDITSIWNLTDVCLHNARCRDNLVAKDGHTNQTT